MKNKELNASNMPDKDKEMRKLKAQISEKTKKFNKCVEVIKHKKS